MIYLLAFGLICILSYYFFRYLWESIQILDLKNRAIFITGCDTGFGHLLALKCVKNGLTVFAGCLSPEGQKRLEVEASNMPGNLLTVYLDVTIDKSIEDAVKFVRQNLSSKQKLWALVNNAGIFGCYGPDEWCTIEHYKKVVDVNTFGPIRCIHAFLPLIKQSSGRIISATSVAGRVTVPWGAPYAVSKYGAEAYMDAIRQELKPFGIKCSILEPGAFKTPFLDQDAMKNRVEETWSKLDDKIRTDYGEAFKNYLISIWNKRLQLAASKRFDDVVDSYYHAITAKYPRCRYRCGWDALLIYTPLIYMPTELQDFILTRMIGITPIPIFLENIIEYVLTIWNSL